MLMNEVAKSNNIPLDEIRSFATSDDVDDFIAKYPNRTQGAYHVITDSTTGGVNGIGLLRRLKYSIQVDLMDRYIRGVKFRPIPKLITPMQIAIDQAAVRLAHGQKLAELGQSGTVEYSNKAEGFGDFDLKVGSAYFPHMEYRTVKVISQQGPSFFLAVLMFSFVSQMGLIVTEKENKLKEALWYMGMKPAYYWASWLLSNSFWNTVTALSLSLIGWCMQFKFFTKNDALTYIVLFELFGLSMVPLCFFCSTLIAHARTATSLGFGLYLLGVMVMGAARMVFEEDVELYYRVPISLFPPALLAKGLDILGRSSDSEDDVGMRFSERDAQGWWTLQDCYNQLMYTWFLYLGLTIFIDFVIMQDENWFRRNLRGICRKHVRSITTDGLKMSNENETQIIDTCDDATITAEKKLVASGNFPPETVIVIDNLKKVFHRYIFGCVQDLSQEKEAVAGVSLHITDKQLFALLGHNGAGKTTMLKMITGILVPSDGDALVCGHSLLAGDIEKIHNCIGVCPQYDILFSQLTAAEHIAMFAGLKGMKEEYIEGEIEERLKGVHLWGVRDNVAGSFSGGMQRRLSLAISLVANPRVVLLDEPTTGMDPISRRQVWDVLEAEKRKRLIILTTHSMEEADALADRIGIIKRGKLRCLGSSVGLKHNYGSGFRLSVVTNGGNGSKERNSNKASALSNPLMNKFCPGAKLLRDNPSEARYKIPIDNVEQLSLLLAALEKIQKEQQQSSAITDSSFEESSESKEVAIVGEEKQEASNSVILEDLQIGLTTLEDVFLKVTSHIEADEENHKSRKRYGFCSGCLHLLKYCGKRSCNHIRQKRNQRNHKERSITPDHSNMNHTNMDSNLLAKKAVSMAQKGRESNNRDLEFTMRTQFVALSLKAQMTERRMWKRNLFQILLPMALIGMLAFFQTVITDIVQENLGVTRPAVVHPPTLPFAMYFPKLGSIDPLSECKILDPRVGIPSITQLIPDYIGGRMLWSSNNDLTQTKMGNYGSQVAASPDRFWAMADKNAQQPSGFLGRVTRDLSSMLSVQGKSYPLRRYETFCLTRPYVSPILFPDSFTGNDFLAKEKMEAKLLESHKAKANGYAAGYDVHTLNLGLNILEKFNGEAKFDVYFNHSLTQGADLPRLVNNFDDAVFKSIISGDPAASDPFKSSTTQSTLSASSGIEPGIYVSGLRFFPEKETVNDFDLISLVGPSFYIFLFQLTFPVCLAGLVYEKEHKLREVMKMMGLKTSVYWVVNYLQYLLMYLVQICFLTGLARYLDFVYFTKNDVWLQACIFFLWGNVQVSSAFFFSVFFLKTRTASVVGYCYIFINGILCLSLFRIYIESSDTPTALLDTVCLFPPFAFYRTLYALREGVQYDGPGLNWEDDVLKYKGYGQPIGQMLIYMLFQWIGMLLMAWYFENTIRSDGLGVKKNHCFCLRSSYYTHKKKASPLNKSQKNLTHHNNVANEFEVKILTKHTDENASLNHSGTGVNRPGVSKERERVWAEEEEYYGDSRERDTTDTTTMDPDVIRLLDIRKVYSAPISGQPDTVAVRGASFGVHKGECFGLLGPNGSGKTTCINSLCGYFEPTSGHARVNGYDIAEDMDLIHLCMGVCPQDNVLWGHLTAGEHIAFFGRLKELSGPELEKEIIQRLTDVQLLCERYSCIDTFSGGMKRRLCVAIAMTGSPPVILLDEPTTGLDPLSRRQLWDVISNTKNKSSILLTTHSMEEANVLCDRIAIMVKGALRCIGRPPQLKNQYGKYYKLSLVVQLDEPNETNEKNQKDKTSSIKDNQGPEIVVEGKYDKINKTVINEVPKKEDSKDNKIYQFVINDVAQDACLIQEPVAGTWHFKLPRKSTDLSFLLTKLENARKITGVKQNSESVQLDDWAVSNITLEEIFLKISNSALEEEGVTEFASSGN